MTSMSEKTHPSYYGPMKKQPLENFCTKAYSYQCSDHSSVTFIDFETAKPSISGTEKKRPAAAEINYSPEKNIHILHSFYDVYISLIFSL